MQIDGLIQALREDLLRVAALGDENTSRAAELLSVAIESSLGRRIQDALAEAALELNDQLESSHVELRVQLERRLGEDVLDPPSQGRLERDREQVRRTRRGIVAERRDADDVLPERLDVTVDLHGGTMTSP